MSSSLSFLLLLLLLKEDVNDFISDIIVYINFQFPDLALLLYFY